MLKETNNLYYSRTETDESIVIVWKPFSTYITYILAAICMAGALFSSVIIPLVAILLFVVNAVVSFAACMKPRKEINEASRNSRVQVSGRKLSTVTILKDGQSEGIVQEVSATKKTGGYVKKIIFGFLTAAFLILGLFTSSTIGLGIRQNASGGSLAVIIVMSLIFFLLAFLCFKALKKQY